MQRTIRALTRIPSGDKIIESRVLNTLGVQVARAVVARTLYRAAPVRVNGIVREKAAELRKAGVVTWPDFLPSQLFEGLQQEYSRLFREHRDALTTETHGPNRLEVAPVVKFTESQLPNTYEVLADPRLTALCEAAERRTLGRLDRYTTMERLIQGLPDQPEDPQTRLHSDVFYSTHKAWLYMTDVSLEDGPFAYVKGSHLLTLTRLHRIYTASRLMRPGDDHSRRISASEMAALGVPETILTCRKNTLVIADTSGYHRRCPGVPGRMREVLHISVRANPFKSMLPGLRTRAPAGKLPAVS